MNLYLGAEIIHIDIALCIAGDSHDLHTGHDCAGGIRPMSGNWNEADGTIQITP